MWFTHATKVPVAIIRNLLAGYYDVSVGYGPETAAPAILVIDENGNVRSELGYAPGFGSDVVGSDFAFDTENNVLTFTATLVAFDFSFDVQFTLQQ